MSEQQEGTSGEPARHQPESLRFRTISPALTVNDFEASLRWYRDVLGLVVGDTWEHEGQPVGAMFKAGDTNLMILQDDFATGQDRVKGEGLRLYCSTAQDIDELAQNIKSRGGKLMTEPADMPWGTRSFSIDDPDGFKLTISSLR